MKRRLALALSLSYERIGNVLFEYLTVVDDEIPGDWHTANRLYGIDLDTDTIRIYAEDVVPRPYLVRIATYNESIVALKYRQEGDIRVSYIEAHEVKDGSTRILLESAVDTSTGVGVEILNLAIDDEQLYLICGVNQYGGADEFEPQILVYDLREDATFSKVIDTARIREFLLYAYPNRFRVFGDYFHLSNYGSENLIGRIEEGKAMSTMHVGSSYSYAQNHGEEVETKIFRKYGINEIRILNTETGDLVQGKLDIAEGYGIANITANGRSAMVTAVSLDERNEKAYRYYLMHD